MELQNSACSKHSRMLGFTEKGLLHLPDLTCIVLKFSHMQDLDSAQIEHIHVKMCEAGLEAYTLVGNQLVSMFGDVRSMYYAQQIFDKLVCQTEQSWNSLLNGYGHSNKPQLVLAVYDRSPANFNAYTFVSLVKACAKMKDLERGNRLYDHVSRMGLLKADIFIGSALVDMYMKCGSVVQAEQVFEKLPHRNVVSWTSLIAGYVNHGRGEKALQAFGRMLCQSVSPNALTFVCCLKACCSLGAKDKVQDIHCELERHQLLEKNLHVGTTLVDTYAKCGSLISAWRVFDNLPLRNVVSWTALIAGYSEHGYGDRALACCGEMELEGILPNAVTYVCGLKACGSIGAIHEGQEIHIKVERHGFMEKDNMIGVSLVDMYAKCGRLAEAQKVFDGLQADNVVLWNALITGYIEHGDGEKALECFEEMQLVGVSPDSVSLLCSLKASCNIQALGQGQELHAEAERQGLLQRDLALASTLVDLYAKSGRLAIAQEIFDKLREKNIVSWNALIAGYAERGHEEEVMKLLERMKLENVKPDSISYLSGLKACVTSDTVDQGGQVLAHVKKQGLVELNVFIGSRLVDLYAKRGTLVHAQEVFDELQVRDVVSWNALVAGYAEHGHGEEALSYLEKMQLEGFAPSEVTFLASLKACAAIGAIDKGRDIHAEIERKGMLEDTLVGNTLVDLYAKCGSTSMAQQVFDKLPAQDVVSWTALMAGYAQVGYGNDVFSLFQRMLKRGVNPNPVTIVVLLTACNRTCMFGESQTYFEAMSQDYGVVPTLKHHACIIDLLSRTGHLEKALCMMNKMPFSPNVVVWHIMLGACRGMGNLEIGKQAFQNAMHLDEKDSAAFSLMSQVLSGVDEVWNVEAVGCD